MKKPGTKYNYRRGRAREYRVMDFLKLRGYSMMRAAQSKGPADLLAGRLLQGTYQMSKILAIQVKGGRSRFSDDDAHELIKFASCFCASAVLSVRGGKWFLVEDHGAADFPVLKPLEDAWF